MWKLLILFVCFSTTFDNTAANNVSSCVIKVRDIERTAPVILTSISGNGYQLFKPTGEVTSLNEGTKLRLLCTGANNAFANTGFDSMDLKCLKGNFVDNKKKKHIHNLKQLTCKDMPSSSLQMTNELCGNNFGYTYNIGFGNNDQFYGPLYEVCYNSDTERAIYTRVTLNGAAIKMYKPKRIHDQLSTDGLQSNAKTTILDKENQIKYFEKYLGKKQKYIEKKNLLEFAQLAAKTDFVFGYEQQATLYYVNAAPEFRAVKVGNWLVVEELARIVAIMYKGDIESYTGHMATLILPHQNRSQVEIYLDKDQKFKVPKYFFKVLIHKASDSAIVFVTVNNPYAVDGAAEEICPNVCRQSGIINTNFLDTTRGYTFCCELNVFKQKVHSLRDQDRGNKLLQFSTVI